MMRSTPRMRLAFAVLSPMFFLLCVVAIHGEGTQPWVPYQEEFARMFSERARVKLGEATAKNRVQEISRWQRVVDEMSRWSPEIKQVYLDDINVADRCTTCHLGIDNPLFEDAAEPFRSHPGDLLLSHDVSRFGCTLCHDGQGLATSTDAAHGREANWARPLLPTEYLQSACARCHELTHGLAGAELVTRGADLFILKGCYGCHDVKGVKYLPTFDNDAPRGSRPQPHDATGARYIPKFAPPLAPLKSKLRDMGSWVHAWIKDPATVSPDTAMPAFELTDEEVGKITAFLLSLPAGEPYKPVALDGASAEKGERLFTERGCRGCHAVKPDEHSASPSVPHLAGIGSKVTPEWLDHWLEDPKASSPDTAMPKVELSPEERHDVVAYLLTLERSEPLDPAPDLSRLDAGEGKELAKRYECFGCHAIEGFERVRPAVPDLAEFAEKPVDELDFGLTRDVPRTTWDWLQRKLREPRVYEHDDVKLLMPVTRLTDEEVQALIAYVLAFGKPTLPARFVVAGSPAAQAVRDLSWMVARLNCNGCHPLDGEEPHVAKFFERKSQVSPTLDGVGGRLQGQYLYDFLLEPKQVRPWMQMRMPTFGFTEAQARVVVDGFVAVAEVDNPYTYVAKANIDEEHYARGFRRFRHFKCIQCHPSSIDEGLPEDIDPDDLSINLMLSKERLRPEWLGEFMARPKQIAGMQTRMPTVFYTVDGVPKVDKPKKDIDDIVTYLMGMKEEPEKTLEAYEAEIKAEEEQEPVDWSTFEY